MHLFIYMQTSRTKKTNNARTVRTCIIRQEIMLMDSLAGLSLFFFLSKCDSMAFAHDVIDAR